MCGAMLIGWFASFAIAMAAGASGDTATAISLAVLFVIGLGFIGAVIAKTPPR